MIRALPLALLLAAGTLCLPTQGYANELVEEGVTAYEDARFDEALELFLEAEQTDVLSKADVESLLLNRALCHYALGDEAAFQSELNKLSRLTPDFPLGASIPPRVRDAFAALVVTAEPLELGTSATRTPDGVRVVARVTGDPGGLVRAIRVYGSTESGEEIGGDEPHLTVPAPEGEPVSYRAEVIGPGGAILRDETATYRDPVPAEVDLISPRAIDPVDDGDEVWPWIVAGAGVVAVATAVAVVLVATASTDTQFRPPEVR